MSSLSGAPPLGAARGGSLGAKPASARLDLDRPVTPEDLDDDDLFPTHGASNRMPPSRSVGGGNKSDSSSKPEKKPKKDKTSKKASGGKKGGTDSESSKPPLASRPAPATTATSEGDYSEDFEDNMPSVFGGQALPASSSFANPSISLAEQQAQKAAANAALEAQLAALQQKEAALRQREEEIKRAEEDRLRRENEERERKMREWNQQEEQRRRQEAMHPQPMSIANTPTKGGSSAGPSPAKAAAQPQASAAAAATAAGGQTLTRRASDVSPSNSLSGLPLAPVAGAAPASLQLNEQLLALLQSQLLAQQQSQQVLPSSRKDDAAVGQPQDNDGSEEGAAFETKTAERERRRRRERERARDQKKVHDEQAAHTLFHRLSNEVREIFRELNLYVVASERERIKKDEAYRRERELRDRQEEAERRERDAKDKRDREEREERFWRVLEERDARFRETAEQRLREDEQRRNERWRNEDTDKIDRTKEEREAREDFLRLERERRDRDDQLARERDRAMLAAQLEEVKRQYRQQMDEMRQQMEIDRQHLQELHKLELNAMEHRHMEAANLTEKHHKDQLALMDLHTANANKLEKLIASAKSELDAAQSMHERLTAERTAAMREREAQLADQQAVVKTMLAELVGIKEQMDKERLRIVSLYSQFEVGTQSFLRESEEERRKNREAQLHLDSLRSTIEKERKAMLHELHNERRAVEEQHNEFVERKMSSLTELQVERTAISKERAEWQLIRERQTRDETELLTSLRHKEEMLTARLEALERDRQSIGEKTREAAGLRDEAAHERELVRRQRNDFELEKADVLRKVEEVHRRAEDAAEAQLRLRKELAVERVGAHHADPLYIKGNDGTGGHAGRSPPHPSVYQMDLARQRAVLNRINSNSHQL